MNQVSKHTIVLLSALMVAALAIGQVNVRASTDKNKILIGEPIKLTVEAYTPLGQPVEWFSSDTIPNFEIQTRSAIDTIENIDGKKIIQTLTITSYDSGRQQIPALEVVVNGTPYYSDTIGIDVAFTPFDVKEDYRDIKDIVEIINPYMKYVPWIVAALAAVSFAIILAIMKKRKTASTNVRKVEAPRLSPLHEAMLALDELERKGVVEGSEKIYYSSMNDILRNYVARRFGISTFERTNEELIMQLSAMHIPKDAFLRLAQCLRMSDFVKFAKFRPVSEDNINNMKVVRSSIELLDNNLASAV